MELRAQLDERALDVGRTSTSPSERTLRNGVDDGDGEDMLEDIRRKGVMYNKDVDKTSGYGECCVAAYSSGKLHRPDVYPGHSGSGR